MRRSVNFHYPYKPGAALTLDLSISKRHKEVGVPGKKPNPTCRMCCSCIVLKYLSLLFIECI